ncbi:nicotinate-nucleotide adenylyltransferase [Schnuerera sp. xch1]|uniref:nicotinate-nucleotide adenylyltransferase n=1 Tax=Schnuerera sp. xch1 TaxID=2874283 RepID=UPI001CC1A750|nr:nicotinate-nucleotide adenylyltransferase [Schnuerera sp. xch1]MBZ2175358.1 nicotinate-nucleotide adenylyltransferase [Schnuerera sp. xch1]
MEKLKIGIMGGTFDPIHNGHLILAEYSRISFNLNKILFIPTGNPPHKNSEDISPNRYRYDMTLLAISTNMNYYLSTIEIERKGVTYTIDTIKYLKSKFEDAEFYFILGADSLYKIHKWKNYEELLSLCNFIVARRPNHNNKKLEKRKDDLNTKYNSSIHILEAPLIDISSTQIRERIRNGLSIKYLVPRSVEAYIEKNRIYRD